jgi:hypothetical protein
VAHVALKKNKKIVSAIAVPQAMETLRRGHTLPRAWVYREYATPPSAHDPAMRIESFVRAMGMKPMEGIGLQLHSATASTFAATAAGSHRRSPDVRERHAVSPVSSL